MGESEGVLTAIK